MIGSRLTTGFTLVSAVLFMGCAGKVVQVEQALPAPTITEAPKPAPAPTITAVEDKPETEPVLVEVRVPASRKRETVADAPSPTEKHPLPEAKELETVFFDYDSAILTPEARMLLDHHAEWFQDNEDVTATIEGHCDERGTNEYNMALGELRATVTRKHLLAQGVTPERLAVVSYGEERPAAGGHDETAWEKNRRVEFR